MEHSKQAIYDLVQQVYAGVQGQFPTPQLLVAALEGVLRPESEMAHGVIEPTPVEDGVAWLIHALTTDGRIIVARGTRKDSGSFEDVEVAVRRATDISSVVAEEFELVDDFSDLDTRARWTFQFGDGSAPIVLSTKGVRNRLLRERIEDLVIALMSHLRAETGR